MRPYCRLLALTLSALCCLGAARGVESPPLPSQGTPAPSVEVTPTPSAESTPTPSAEVPTPSAEITPAVTPTETSSPTPSPSETELPSNGIPIETPSVPSPAASPTFSPEPPAVITSTPSPTPEREVITWIGTLPALPFLPYLLPLGSSLYDVTPLAYDGCFSTENSDLTYLCFINWDFSQLELSEAGLYPQSTGLYTISGMPDVTEYFVLSPDVEPFHFQLAVVSPDYIDLTASVLDGPDQVLCLLYCRPNDPSRVQVLRSEEDGPWQELSPGTDYLLESDAITFYIGELAQDVTYRYQVCYDGDGRSNVLSVRRTGDEVLLETAGEGHPATGATVSTPSPTPSNDWGGDRDGGDWDDQDIPPISTPDPEPSESIPSQTPTPQPTAASSPRPTASSTPQPSLSAPLPSAPSPTVPPVSSDTPSPSPVHTNEPAEFRPSGESGDTSTLLSGQQLEQMAENAPADTLLFEKDGVAAELSSQLLKELGLEAQELLEVTVERPAEDAFRLTVQASGATVTDIPGTTVRFPWTGTAEGLVWVHLESGQKLPARYEAESGTVVCDLSAAGTYQLCIQVPPTSSSPLSPSPSPALETAALEETNAPPLWVLPAGGLTVGGIALLLWRKRHA